MKGHDQKECKQDVDGVAQRTTVRRKADDPNIDAYDVDHYRQKQERPRKRSAPEAEQHRSCYLSRRDQGCVSCRIAKVVPGEPETRNVSHRLCQLRVKNGKLRAHDLRKAITEKGVGSVIARCQVDCRRNSASRYSGDCSHRAYLQYDCPHLWVRTERGQIPRLLVGPGGVGPRWRGDRFP